MSPEPTTKPEESGDEGGSKGAAVLVGAAYATGLVTANIFLYNHGITDFSLLKPKAVITGALVLCSLSLFAFIPSQVASEVAQNHGLRKPLRIVPLFRIVAKLLIPLFLGMAVCWFLRGERIPFDFGHFDVTARERLRDSFMAAIQFYLAGTLSAVLAVQSVRAYRFAVHKSSFSGMANRWALFTLWGTGLLLALVWYISVFAGFVYVIIPPQFGGGRPESFRFKIKQDSVVEVRKLGISFLKDTNITEPLDVIHESDEFIAILLSYETMHTTEPDGTHWAISERTTLRLDKKLIEASLVDFSGSDEGLTTAPDEAFRRIH